MNVVIAGYARTPFVRANGAFADLPAVGLGSIAIRSALLSAGITPDAVDAVFGGQVLQAGAGQNPARQSAVHGGIPLTIPALTINAVCLSGTLAISQGARLIADGDADVVVAVGQESMSRAPHAWVGSRAGKRFGPVTLVDTLEIDGLTDAFQEISMGASTQAFADEAGLTRELQDEWAARSHRLSAASTDFFAGEIAPVEVPGRTGTTVVSADDGIRADSTTEVLARLRPAFSASGTITAGNASPVSDGAAAVVLIREDLAPQAPLGRIVGHAFVAGPDVSLLDQPARATAAALAKIGRTAADLASVEINEAFAAVALSSTRTLDIDPEIVNPHGGAIALGHPIGASGARIVGTLARQLAAGAPGALGAAAICGGGGQGAAVLVESL